MTIDTILATIRETSAKATGGDWKVRRIQWVDVPSGGLHDDPNGIETVKHHPQSHAPDGIAVYCIRNSVAYDHRAGVYISEANAAHIAACSPANMARLLAYIDEQAARHAATENADLLPCDVMLPPATRIGAGCSVQTLMSAIARRRERPPQPFTVFDRAEKAEAECLAEKALASTELAARLRAEGKLADAITMRERAERERDILGKSVDAVAAQAEKAERELAAATEALLCWQKAAADLGRERDEARAAVTRLREAIRELSALRPACGPEQFADTVNRIADQSLTDTLSAARCICQDEHRKGNCSEPTCQNFSGTAPAEKWPIGTRVEKVRGANWRGRVVGRYSTALTADGYCVESEWEPGSVQIYPHAALRAVDPWPGGTGEKKDAGHDRK